jgi:hypothetical protein
MASSTSICNDNMPKEKHSKFQEIIAPETVHLDQPSVFLAGSIEMGKAKEWQTDMTRQLSDLPITVLNPRRPDWNKDWKQEANFHPFKEQVDWEMDSLIACDIIALYFQSGTLSPISLLELGLHAADGKLIVFCEEGFWRKGNVEMVCFRYGIPLVTTEEDFALETRKALEKKIEERT